MKFRTPNQNLHSFLLSSPTLKPQLSPLKGGYVNFGLVLKFMLQDYCNPLYRITTERPLNNTNWFYQSMQLQKHCSIKYVSYFSYFFFLLVIVRTFFKMVLKMSRNFLYTAIIIISAKLNFELGTMLTKNVSYLE